MLQTAGPVQPGAPSLHGDTMPGGIGDDDAVQRKGADYTLSTQFHDIIGVLNSINFTNAALDLLSAPLNDTVNGTANGTANCKTCFCEGMRDVLSSYRHAHGYIALAVCLFGTVANLLNVIVLTRKELAGAPINRILTWLAVADMLVMVEYVPFACYMYLVLPERKDFPRLGAIFILFHSHFAQLLHTISICLTLALAVWRYISIRYPQHSHSMCSQRRCSLAILVSFALPVVVCAPSYLAISIQEVHLVEEKQIVTLYHVDLSELAKEHSEFLYILNFWVYSVLIKLLPCTILTVISVWLIKALYRAKGRKAQLRDYNALAGQGVQQNGGCSAPAAAARRPTRAERRTDRTTRMLLAILLLFLITEFPQGILGLLSGIHGHEFFRFCYQLFGEVMDILALLNGAINFILYCAMNRQFRTTFGQLFKPRGIMAKLQGAHGPATSQTEVQSTYV